MERPAPPLSKAVLDEFRAFYGTQPWLPVEFEEFDLILNGSLSERTQHDISSGGYVLDTLTASIWCLLATDSFEECVLKAVNLGGDTDTTACVAGGLARVHYGMAAIRQSWIESLARATEIKFLFESFADLRIE